MNRLTIRKLDPGDPSKVHFDEAASLYSHAAYEVRVFADDFRGRAGDPAKLQLVRKVREDDAQPALYAECSLWADPYRRDCRFGTLDVASGEYAALWAALSPDGARNVDDSFTLAVFLGAGEDKVVYAQVPVVVASAALASAAVPPAEG